MQLGTPQWGFEWSAQRFVRTRKSGETDNAYGTCVCPAVAAAAAEWALPPPRHGPGLPPSHCGQTPTHSVRRAPAGTTFARNIGCFADSALSPVLSVRLTLSPRRDMRLGVCKALADEWEGRGNPTLVYIGLQVGLRMCTCSRWR